MSVKKSDAIKGIIPDGVKMTPWLEQYAEFKAQYPDVLLLFRMGDFYELFFDDAKIASAVLDIALTSRNGEKKIQMAGVPHHALNQYLGRLIRAGHRAAICEQIGEPAKGNMLTERRVVRVVTPGTWVPEESSESANGFGENNPGHLAAICPVGSGSAIKKIALALLAVDTGRLEAGTLPIEEAAAQLSAFAPSEVLYPSSLSREKLPEFLRELALRPIPRENFSKENGASRLAKALSKSKNANTALGSQSVRLESFGIEPDDPCTGPAWVVLDYLSATQFSAASHVLKLTPLSDRDYMILDSSAQRNLEIMPETAPSGISLFSCMDECKTQMGKRTLRNWLLRPLLDTHAIERRQEAIGLLIEDPGHTVCLRDTLSGTRDIERALSRLAINTSNPFDLVAIRDTLRLIPELRTLVSSFRDPLAGLFKSIPDLNELSQYLNDALEERPARTMGQGAIIKSSFDEDLAACREADSRGEEWFDRYVEHEREVTGCTKLRGGRNHTFGYYLELSKSNLANFKLPDYFERSQTLVNTERFTTPELRAHQDRMSRSSEESERIETELIREVQDRILEETGPLQMTGRLLGVLDSLASAAVIARERNYTRPEVLDNISNDSNSSNENSNRLEIKGGRHPVLETTIKDIAFVPNDVMLGGEHEDARVIILTGPNMAGKSTWLRMTALLAIMAQAGLWVPAEHMSLGLVDRVFTRIGARDDLVRGSSTFMVEMLETANILNNITDRSLVILDEVGRGTATWDGMSIAWAVLEHLQASSRARVLFATHCHELTCLEERLEGVKNYNMAVTEGKDGIIFLHQVVPGPASRSYGIEVARLAGLPKVVLKRAFDLLKIFEREGFERSSLSAIDAAVPEPLPQEALKRQLLIFSPEQDAIIEEIAGLNIESLTPTQALSVLSRLQDKARLISGS